MISRFLLITFALAVSAAAQISITGSAADYELAEGPVLGSTTATTTRAGASNAASNPGLRNLVYLFALPAAPGGQGVTSAKLSFTYVSKSSTPTFNADLWGIGFQAGTTPILKALKANTDSDSVKVQDNIIEPATALGRITSGNFASYIGDFYTANPGYTGGTFVFLRLNGDAGSTSAIGYNCATANNAGNEPVLEIQFGAPLADVHPRLMAGPADRARIQSNIRTVPWFATAYTALYNALPTYVNRHRTDPSWILSRMQMNWVTKFTVDTVVSERWSSGSGAAPVPTPRFGGARDWSTNYALDSGSAALPYNDDPAGTGKIWMKDRTTGVYAWINPGLTGNLIENANENLMAQARDAAFVWWLTGDEAYAKFAADIFWQFWYGFSFKQSPPNGASSVCGSFTFEVIHDTIIESSAVTYDFLFPYLVAQGKDTALIEAQFKRVADREIAAGNPDGNWNVIQAKYLTHLALTLQPNAAYADGKGREYYVDVILNAALPKQTGLATVLATGYDQATALWPEAWGYGIGVTENITEVLSLLDRSGYGSQYFASGILPRAALVQFQMFYPHGWAANCGDSSGEKTSTLPMELLAASAQRRGDATTLAQMVGALQYATTLSSGYDRAANRGLLPLCFYLADLPTAQTTPPVQNRSFYAAPLNQWIMRTNTPDYRFSLGSSLAGTAGGHSQNQGLAMELFGAGMTIAPDPTRGSSYWQPDYLDYIDKPPSHNAVIVGGLSNAGGAFTTRAVEPATTAAPVSPNFGFVYADLSNSSPSSVSADQRRLIAHVLTSDTSGFYFDIFRSKLKSTTAPSQFHDYLYHSIGQATTVSAVNGTMPTLATSSVLTSTNGNQKGYDYFLNEKSAAFSGDFKTVFDIDSGNAATSAQMTTWMLAQPDRTIFTATAPDPNVTGSYPSVFNDLDMLTLIVRQNNNAWTNPFISVLEPSLNTVGPKVTAVQPLGAFNSGNTIMVAVDSNVGDPSLPDTTYLFSDDSGARQNSGNLAFKGTFGAIQVRDGTVSELYLGSGFEVTGSVYGVKAVSTSVATSASLRAVGADWFCAAKAPVTATLPRSGARLPRVTLDNGVTTTIPAGLVAGSTADGPTYSFTVPTGNYTIHSDFTVPNIPGYAVDDIGTLATPTLASVASGVYTMSASGADIGGSVDAFGFLHQSLADDMTLITRVVSLDNTNPAAKAGLMIRSGTAANAIYAAVFVTPASGVLFQRRTSTGGSTATTTTAGIQPPVWLKLVRQSNLISASYSTDGVAWTPVGSATVAMPSGLEVGLALTAKDNTKVAEAVFDNVSMTGSQITTPPLAPSGFTAVGASSSSVSLAWSAASTATSYTVKRATVSGGPYTLIVANLTATTYLDTGLASGTYYYVVTATNVIGESSNSSPASATLSAQTLATTYPVEDATHASYGGGATLDSNNAGFNGTGFINLPTTGGFVQFVNVNGGSGGAATLSIRYALGTTTRTGALLVNGVSQSISFAGTGAWTTWVTMNVAVTLNSAATNTIRFESNGQDLGNIDEITVAPSYSAVEMWRWTHFATTANTGNAADNADPDGDGWNNAQEFISGTNPTDSTSMLKFSSTERSGNNVVLSFSTVSSKTYRVECSETMQPGSWLTVEAGISGTGSAYQVTDLGGAAHAQRFYRLVVQ